MNWTTAPGQEHVFFGNDATPDIASGARTLDLAGTGSQVLDVVIILGSVDIVMGEVDR